MTFLSPSAQRIHRAPFGRVNLDVRSIKNLRRASTCIPQASASRHQSFPPSLLDLAGSPAETFCLVPDPMDLIALDENWPESDRDRAAMVSLAIGEAFDQAIRQQPWLNRWAGDQPIALWHWGRRISADITPLNGGTMGMSFVWSVFDEAGVACSVRASCGPWVPTPCGILLAQPNCTWRFTEKPWSPETEHEVTVSHVIDEINLPVPRPVDSSSVRSGPVSSTPGDAHAPR